MGEQFTTTIPLCASVGPLRLPKYNLSASETLLGGFKLSTSTKESQLGHLSLTKVIVTKDIS